MIRIEVVLPENDVKAISNGLKKLSIGGITAYRGWGRGKSINPQIHASKGTEMFTPEFGDRFILDVIVADEKKDEVVKIIRSNTNVGKIFVSEINEVFDIQSDKKNEETI